MSQFHVIKDQPAVTSAAGSTRQEQRGVVILLSVFGLFLGVLWFIAGGPAAVELSVFQSKTGIDFLMAAYIAAVGLMTFIAAVSGLIGLKIGNVLLLLSTTGMLLGQVGLFVLTTLFQGTLHDLPVWLLSMDNLVLSLTFPVLGIVATTSRLLAPSR